ncbi:MAG TPA: S8 family serine peptidase [Fimbriimonadaceae bacterium]|nr:S8 family serine peptidase [Fimbriimonadaceae bacterium]
MKTRLCFALAIALAAFGAVASAQDYVPGVVLVKFRANARQPFGTINRLHARVENKVSRIGVERIRLARGGSVEAAVAAFRRDPDVLYAEPDYRVRIFDNDPYFNQQWDLPIIDAPEAWQITTGNPLVLVASLDTGADLTHPDLAGQIAASKNLIGGGSAVDGNGHGTHTAGTVAALTNNGIGVASLGCKTRLLIGKVIGDNGQGDIQAVIDGIVWAETSGARVITMSFGTTSPSSALQDAVSDAWNSGIVVVAAAGNNGTTQKVYPAACDGCIAVAATDKNDRRCSFSSFGDWVHLSAPGLSILSLYRSHGYAIMSGTSMAAPHVAALAALLWANGARSNVSIRNALINSADPTTGFNGFPAPRINARRAILRLP